jgi:DNA mismatch repair protein MutS
LFVAARPKSVPPAAPAPSVPPAGPSALDLAVDGARPDEMTPREALDLLYKLKALRPKA